MKRTYYLASLLIISLSSTCLAADPRPSGTKGQNYDTLVFENPTDGEVSIVAKVRTVSTLPGSSSTITVIDNGQKAFGPRTDEAPAWKQQIAVRGKGRHEITIVCGNEKSSPVYCSLDVDETRVTVSN